MPTTQTLWMSGGIVTGCLIFWIISSRKTRKRFEVVIAKPSVANKDEEIFDQPEAIEEVNEETWAVAESENLMKLVVAIAEEQTTKDTIVHRSVSCNHCGASPIRGIRYKCANCVDFDLCAMCENLQIHYKTHTFIKIRIPIPPHSNPRTMIFPSFYPGSLWTDTASFNTIQLEKETHCIFR
jgi:hypothetical protein